MHPVLLRLCEGIVRSSVRFNAVARKPFRYCYWFSVRHARRLGRIVPVVPWYRRSRSRLCARLLPTVQQTELLLSQSDETGDPALPWVFQDESWTRVINRFAHRQVVLQGGVVDVVDKAADNNGEFRVLSDGTMCFSAPCETFDEWLYVYLDPVAYSFRNFSWEFELRRSSNFREFQFGIRYVDFYNRYRIRFEDNKCCFDIVHRGQFLNSLAECECPLSLGRWYHVRIDIVGWFISCYVDGKCMVAFYDRGHFFDSGSIAVILWESRGQPEINAEVRNLRVWRIARKVAN